MGHEIFFHFSQFSFLRFLLAFFDYFFSPNIVNFWLARSTGHSFTPGNVRFDILIPLFVLCRNFFGQFRSLYVDDSLLINDQLG